MNVLDENIIAPERERLCAWRVHFRRIGEEIGHLGMKDHEEIVPLLHTLLGLPRGAWPSSAGLEGSCRLWRTG